MDMEKKKNSKITDNLLKAVLSLDSLPEARSFFRDLCTIDELKERGERLEIAKLLDRKLTYREIASELEVSTTTVSRVATWLNNGAGGYRIVLDKTADHHDSSKVFRKS